jgi:phenylalanyl-tRNA synthetase beta chain
MKLFEIGKVYLPKKNDLPNEVYKIGIATNTDYFDLKGIIEAIYKELNITNLSVPEIIEKDGVFMAEIDFQSLIDNCQLVPKYKPIHPYAIIKLDKTFEIQPHTTYAVVRQKAFQSILLQKIEVVTLYQNKLTLRFYYSSPERNITEKEAKKELGRI